jgi:hypothetical protein
MADKKPVDLSFPLKGADENWAYKAQPEGTSPGCLNVRPYDVLGQRLRGGQRAGLSKYIAAQPNGAIPIQMLGTVTQPGTVSGMTLIVPPLATLDFATNVPSASYQAVGHAVTAEYNALADGAYYTVTAGQFKWAGATCHGHIWKTPVGGGYVLEGSAAVETGGTDTGRSGIILRAARASGGLTAAEYGMVIISTGIVIGGNYKVRLRMPTATWTSGVPYTAGQRIADATYGEYYTALTNHTAGVGNLTPPGNTTDWVHAGYSATVAITNLTEIALRVEDTRGTIKVYADGVLKISVINAELPSNNYVGWILSGMYAGSSETFDGWSVSNGVSVEAALASKIVVVSGGNVYSGTKAGLTLATSGTGAVSATHAVRGVAAYGKFYMVDGTLAGYRMFDPATSTVYNWQTLVTGLIAATYLPTDLTLTNSLGGTMIARYRGRIVIAGLASDPQNWFMSAASPSVGTDMTKAPLDWNYGATPSATMAVAGNNSLAGLVGDRITCLAPANDDLMVIGGDHTVWVMRGDPADGGRIDNVSQTTGISGPDAFAFDPQAIMYFFGNGVLWRLVPTGELTPISRGRMDKTFGAIDLSLNNVVLAWDTPRHGLHIYVTPFVSGASTHYFWDARTDSFWPESYPNAHGPTAVLPFDANDPDDQALLLGGQDGYVRKIDATAKTDDGTTILSRVKFPPMTPGSVHLNARLSRVITVLESTSDPVSLRIFAAQSPEEVVAATTPAWAYGVTAVNRYSIPRVTGNSLMFELKNDSFSTAWVTGHGYVMGDQVVAPGGLPYVCLGIHTSGVFATDLAGPPARWVVSDFRTWALESVNAIIETSGRTRHGRL